MRARLFQIAYGRGYLLLFALASLLSAIGAVLEFFKPQGPDVASVALFFLGSAIFLVAALTVRRGIPSLTWAEQSVLVGPIVLSAMFPAAGLTHILKLRFNVDLHFAEQVAFFLPLGAGVALHLLGALLGSLAVGLAALRRQHLRAWFYAACAWNVALLATLPFLPR